MSGDIVSEKKEERFTGQSWGSPDGLSTTPILPQKIVYFAISPSLEL
jgi:hypothetical protein